MDKMFFNFFAEVKRNFGELANNFDLKIVPVSDEEILLVGTQFALSIAYGREGLDVAYLEKTEHGLRSYRVSNFLNSNKFKPDDRVLYGHPMTGTEKVLASMRVFASGLQNQCGDILKGEKGWLIALKKRDTALWTGDPPSAKVASLLGDL